MSNQKKKYSFTSLSRLIPPLALFLILVLFLLHWGDQKQIFAEIKNVRPLVIFTALSLSLLNYGLRFLRWQFFLTRLKVASHVSPSSSFLIFLTGLGMAITPMRGGELIKSYFLKDRHGISFSTTAPLFFIERLTDAFAMLFLMFWGVMSFRLGWWVFGSAFLVCLAFVTLFQKKQLWPWFFKVLSRLPLVKKYITKADNFFRSASSLTHPSTLLAGSLLAILAWFAQISGGYFILTQVNPQFAGLAGLFTITFIFTFSAAIGFTVPMPGGIGVAEPTTIGLLILLFTLSRDQAITVALLSRATTLWFGTSIGLLAIFFFLKCKNQSLSSNG